MGILKRDGRLLVGQRPSDKPYSGYWEFPGGKIEADETAYQALVRELREELGVEVKQASLWFEHSHVYPDKTVFLEIWQVESFMHEPEPQENQSLRWASLAEIMDLKLLEGNWPVLEKIKQLL